LKTKVIGISDMMVSKTPNETLITYSLGSCLGVVIYDPVVHVAGLLHSMLPLSKIDPQKAKKSPFMFVDTGVPLLFREAFKLGAEKQRLIVKAVGCSSLLKKKGFFKIGERNFTVHRKLLWKNNILIEGQDVDGNGSRTVKIQVKSGNVIIKSGGEKNEL